MDSASASELQNFLANNATRMDQQEDQLRVTGQAIQTLVAQVADLSAQLRHLRTETVSPPVASPLVPSAPASSSGSNEPRLPPPSPYAGEPQLCRAFLTKCSLFFTLQPSTYATEQSKVALVMTLLTGKASLWGTAVWENKHPCVASFQALADEMRQVFDRAVTGREAARLLADLRQGNRSVADYAIEFRTLAAECKWNQEAQWDMFLHGLAERIQREIFALELPSDLDGLIALAI